MAYALVAGLPPVTGLYASILPPIAYALFGSSMVQSVGPMAITSLMIGTSLATLAPPGSALSMVLAGQMALIAGVILFLSGVFRLGFVAGFLSRPVMSGFTTGAALLIASGQLEPLLGGPLASPHLPSAIIGLASLLALWLAKPTWRAPGRSWRLRKSGGNAHQAGAGGGPDRGHGRGRRPRPGAGRGQSRRRDSSGLPASRWPCRPSIGSPC
jgi:hypothetical protein